MVVKRKLQVLQMRSGERPVFSDRQLNLARDLIGLGLQKSTIIAVMLRKDTADLTQAEVTYGNTHLGKLKKELGYGVMDARRAQTPAMQGLVQRAANDHGIRIRLTA